MRISRSRLRLNALCILCLSTCAACACCRAQASFPAPTSQKLFDFHSGFWINLHHFLYAAALVFRASKSPQAQTLNAPDEEELGRLSPEERTTWNAATSYYAVSLVQRDLLFDEGMEEIKNRLEGAETSIDLAGTQIPDDLKAALLSAAPIYRKHWWTRHDADNRRWIADVQALVGRCGSSISDSLVRIYEVPWPEYPVRVDAVAYANWAGAYTTIHPTRPTISTTDPANQGTAALEIVFHETSHGMMNKVMDGLDAAEKAATPESSIGPIHSHRDLWHEILFYTSGELVAGCIPGYAPYADKNGLWMRAWSGPDRALIERDWKPHMSGAVPLSAALAKLVEDLVPGSR